VTGFAHLRALASTASRCQSASHCGLDQTLCPVAGNQLVKTGSSSRTRLRPRRQPSMPDDTAIHPGFPTVAEVLALDAVRAGNPRVGAGAAGLDRRVRWVHVNELIDVREILRGGELVLSTAIAWPDDREALEIGRAHV